MPPPSNPPASDTHSTALQAQQLGLTTVSLTPADVTAVPTDVLPISAIEARKILPYRFDAATATLFVAVADVGQLKQAAPKELQQQRQRGRTLTLQLIEPSQFEALLPTVRPQFGVSHPRPGAATPAARSAPTHPQYPPVDLTLVEIPRAVFLKIPRDVAEKFRLVAFESDDRAKTVKLASDQPSDPGVQRVVAVIKQKRGVTAQLQTTSKGAIDGLLAAYLEETDPVTLKKAPETTQVPVQPSPSPRLSIVPSPIKPDTSTAAAAQSSQPVVSPPVAPPAPRVPLPPLPPLPKPGPAVTVGSPSVNASRTPPPSVVSGASGTGEQPKPPSATPKVPASVSMPVDTSPVTTKLPPLKATTIQLATPLPLLTGSSHFPLPPMTAPPPVSVPLPASVLPPPPTLRAPLTPSPMAQRTIGTGALPPPVDVPASTAEVLPAELSNQSALTSLTVIEATEDQLLDTTVGSTIQSPAELESVVKTGLVPKILAAILQYAVATSASDIHVEATQDSLRIRYRIDGLLQDVLKAPVGLHAPLVSRLKILSHMKIDEQRIPQDGRFTATTHQHDVDFRVSSLPAIHGEKIVPRILDKSVGLRSIDKLGIDGANGERISAALKKPFGIILVTGPTGSGKTTTLYAMLTTLNQPGVYFVTLEDPVEYELAGITQTQVKPKIGFGFAEGLRSILRQDPDVIMVGEIRDRETASLATHAALTGHLVLSTLHTNNAAGAIPRFIDMGVEPFLIASSIEAVIAQRLARRLCEQCRQPATISDAVRKDIVLTLAASPVAEVKARASQPLSFFGPKGCEACHDGYKGRVGLYEVMSVTSEIESLTATKAPLGEIAQLAAQQGMVTMKQDGLIKASTGLTSLDEVFRVTTSD